MKALFASADFGLIGLLFFFAVFLGIAIWAYNPRRKDTIERLKHIPFTDEESHDRS